jgi:hypothetical protein
LGIIESFCCNLLPARILLNTPSFRHDKILPDLF